MIQRKNIREQKMNIKNKKINQLKEIYIFNNRKMNIMKKLKKLHVKLIDLHNHMKIRSNNQRNRKMIFKIKIIKYNKFINKRNKTKNMIQQQIIRSGY